MKPGGVYRTESGSILRISEDEEGRLCVERLIEAGWVSGPVQMAGLRLSPTTVRLTAREIRRLPG